MKALFAALLLLLTSLTSTAQVRTQDYMRDLVRLAGILGGAHAIRVACNGRDDQYWRGHMIGLLDLEAPDASPLRRSMVDAFNRGYQVESSRRGYCDDDAVSAEAAYAREGREISDRLSESLLPRRPASQNRR